MDNTRCPRCGGAFHCGAGGSTPCACGSVTLDPELTRQIGERYLGCLCLACLAQLKAQAEGDTDAKKPARRETGRHGR